jgi:hypothetical protein
MTLISFTLNKLNPSYLYISLVVRSKLLITFVAIAILRGEHKSTKDSRSRKKGRTMGSSLSCDIVGYVNNHLSLLYHVSRCPYLTSTDGNLLDVISR